MSKVKDVVKNIVRDNPLYAILISSGLVNYTSLARQIQEQVVKSVSKDVKINTIVKALTEEKINTDSWNRQMEVLSRCDLSLEYRYEEREVSELPTNCKEFAFAYNYDGKIRIVGHNSETGNLACIKVKLPNDGSDVPGLTFFIVQHLSINGTKVERIYRLDREILLITNQNSAARVMTLLSDLILKSHM